MKGGYQILDLRNITLKKDEETTITDQQILDQLLGLTDFLNAEGVVDKQLKPIYIITKDSAGFVSITNTDENELLIDGFINGLHIAINIAYESTVDDYGNTVYSVDEASYNYAELSGGTKLYRHDITFISDNEEEGEFTIINFSDNPLNLASGTIEVGYDCVAISTESSNDLWTSLPQRVDFLEDSLQVNVGEDFNTYEISNSSSITDTVTPL